VNSGFWQRYNPFRPRPLGDIAQCVIDLMQDESQWRAHLLSVQHQASDLCVRNTGFFISVASGHASVKLEGRDASAVERAYGALRKRIKARARRLQEQALRRALVLPEPPPQPQVRRLPPAEEPIEVVEQRVRRLREALARAS
jgi:hypothetical protein